MAALRYQSATLTTINSKCAGEAVPIGVRFRNLHFDGAFRRVAVNCFVLFAVDVLIMMHKHQKTKAGMMRVRRRSCRRPCFIQYSLQSCVSQIIVCCATCAENEDVAQSVGGRGCSEVGFAANHQRRLREPCSFQADRTPSTTCALKPCSSQDAR